MTKDPVDMYVAKKDAVELNSSSSSYGETAMTTVLNKTIRSMPPLIAF